MKYKCVKQLEIEKLDHNNCIMPLDTYFANTLIINYADWIKMGNKAGWKMPRFTKQEKKSLGIK